MAKEVATTGSGFAIVSTPEAREVMAQAFELGVTNFQLSRIKIPAGGMTAWEVEGLEGTEVHQEIEAIIIAIKGRQKAWWSKALDEGGGGTPPTCSSQDGQYGYGVNTLEEGEEPSRHECASCHWNQFGSDRGGGRGKECKDHSLMFFFRKDSRVPSLLIVPATSLKAVQLYALKLIDAGKRMESIVTKLKLKKAQSASGITYATLDLAYGSDLPESEAASMMAVAKDFRERLSDFDAYADNPEN